MAHFTSRLVGQARRRIRGFALIVQGGLAALTSGRVGNTVFSRNRGGAYVRNFVKPVNPNTALQAAIRGTFAATVAAWQTLDAAAQGQFADVAAASPQPNRVGLTSILPPLSMFQKINVGRLAVGLDLVTTAPSLPITDDWDPSAFSAEITANNSIDFSYDGLADWVLNGTDQDALLIFVSPPQSPSKNFYKGKYNFFVGLNGGTVPGILTGFPGGLAIASGGGSSGLMSLSLLANPTFVVDAKYFIRAYVTRADGHTGPETTAVTVGV